MEGTSIFTPPVSIPQLPPKLCLASSYLCAYGNPTVYVDLFGFSSTNCFSQFGTGCGKNESNPEVLQKREEAEKNAATNAEIAKQREAYDEARTENEISCIDGSSSCREFNTAWTTQQERILPEINEEDPTGVHGTRTQLLRDQKEALKDGAKVGAGIAVGLLVDRGAGKAADKVADAYGSMRKAEKSSVATKPKREELTPAEAHGIPGGKAFESWFNNKSVSEIAELYKDKEARQVIKSRLRHGGGDHEWLMVSRAAQVKAWGRIMLILLSW